MYRRMYAGPQLQLIEQKILGFGPNWMATEVAARFDCFAADVISRDVTIITVEGDLVVSERLYSDPSFTEAMRRALGDDFGDVPGVTRIDW